MIYSTKTIDYSPLDAFDALLKQTAREEKATCLLDDDIFLQGFLTSITQTQSPGIQK